MLFLYPAFLFALASLLIPVVVHLFNFRRYQKVYFSNVQFLKDVQEQQSSRKNLKERLILASRMLAITFLVLAFAKPYLPGVNAANAGKQQVVSIFVDNSYSMQTLNREGSLLDEAKRRAKEIASVYSINDRFQLLTQDFEGKHQRLLSRDEFNDAVDTLRMSAQSRSLQQIVSRQQRLLNMSTGKLKSIYVISDFQKNMGNSRLKVDTGLHLNLVKLKASALPNVAVDSVNLLSPIHRPGDPEKLIVRMHNYADEIAKKIPLKLRINGVEKAIGSYTVKPRSVQYDTLTFSGLAAGWQRAEISLQDNPVTFDNQFYFSFNVKQKFELLLIDGGTPNLFLKAAFAADPFFNAKRAPDGNIDYATLNTYPLIILSDIAAISTGLSQQLNNYISKGGTLLVFPAAGADLPSYQSFLKGVNAAWPEKLIVEPTTVSDINLQNPVFKNVFESLPKNPDLPVVKSYYELGSNYKNRAENLMELPGKKPFLAGYSSGKGKVYISAVPLTEDFSNLPRHGLFIPILFRIALLSGHDLPLFYTLGNAAPVEIPPVQLTADEILKLIKNNLAIIPGVKQQEGNSLLYVADQLRETGIYDLKKQDSTVATLAFNDNRSESDLSYLTGKDLTLLAPHAAQVIEAGSGLLKEDISDTNFGMQLWKLCIILALVFLAAEILLVRYFKTGLRGVSGQV